MMLKRLSVLCVGLALCFGTIGCGSNEAYMPEEKGEPAPKADPGLEEAEPLGEPPP